MKPAPCKRITVFLFTALLATCLAGTVAHAEDDLSSPFSPEPTQGFGLLDAGQRGASAGAEAKAVLTPAFDAGTGKDILELNYSIPQNASVQVWAKNFPAELKPPAIDTIKIGIQVPNTGEAGQVTVQVELRGTVETQTITVPIGHTGWNWSQQSIEWKSIGNLSEVVFTVSPLTAAGPVEGSLSLGLDFIKRLVVLPPAAPENVQPAVAAAPAAVSSSASEAAVAAPATGQSSFSLLDSADRGRRVTGGAKGSALPTFDEVTGKDVLEFEFKLPEGSSATIWAKMFPADLTSSIVDTVQIGTRVLTAGLASDVSLAAEIKGALGTQTIPVELAAGWSSTEEAIDWQAIGNLREVSFIASPKDSKESVEGTLAVALNFVKQTAPASGEAAGGSFPSVFNLLDAGAKGVFNIGPAQGTITNLVDEITARDVWEFAYAVPIGSHVGIWTKDYPEEVDASRVDAVRIGVNVPNGEDLKQVAVKAEIKGTHQMQTIRLNLKPGRNDFREAINWNTIGPLKEAVFVVSPVAADPAKLEGSAEGTLVFELDFGKLSFFEKHFIYFKAGVVLLLGFLAAFFASFIHRRFGHTESPKLAPMPPPASFLSHLKWDLFYAALAVLIAGCTLAIYSFGIKSPLEISFSFIWIALAGTGASEALKLRFTGKHLSRGEALQNMLVAGLLAASSSRIAIFQSPSSWGQVLMLSPVMATIAFLIYYISTASSLARTGRHLKPITAGMITGVPYLFGWILLLENSALLQSLANTVTLGLLAGLPLVREIIGRFLIVLIFNEALINAISYATKSKPVATAKAHLVTAFVSLTVILAPEIADLGSGVFVGALPLAFRGLATMATTMISYAGLWGETYLITGMILDGMKRTAPSRETISKNIFSGMKKGMAYSGILVAFLFGLAILVTTPTSLAVMKAFPLLIGTAAGALSFPIFKTIIETFDGSIPFLERMRFSYRDYTLSGRGAVAGFGFTYMVTGNLFKWDMGDRMLFGLVIGLIASGGISLLRDAVYAFKKQGRIQSWRLYLIDSLLGAFVGSAATFYMDSAQMPVVIAKFKQYTSAGFQAVDYITYPLVNKWGRIDLGTYSGGAKLLFSESLAGVINWAIAAWLFAINKVLLQAVFEKDRSPIQFFFSKAGFIELMNHMLYVLRWGLWMSPIIFTFLRMMPEPTWYNQDGAIRTIFAIANGAAMPHEAFREWSLTMFVYVLAFDFFRVLIWMDHMGLRVATLVNLSFIGMDRLDEKIARFIGPASAQRYIPEAVKRFTTWAPLLIPFYLPRGADWDYAWNASEAIQNAKRGGLISFLGSLPLPQLLLIIAGAVAVATGVSFVFRMLGRRARKRTEKVYQLDNHVYKTFLKGNGEAYSEVIHKEFFDVTRRAYDVIDPCGRILFLTEPSETLESGKRYWPVIGNFPEDKFNASHIGRVEDVLRAVNASSEIRTTVDITLPDRDATVELWTITIENLSAKNRQLKLVPYLEWVLNGWHHDRFHTQYARLFPEMEYASELNTILAWHKSSKLFGVLASDAAPEGFMSSRMDFIGRAQSIWKPRILETLKFFEPRDTAGYPTFDPIGSFLINVELGAKASKTVRLLLGHAAKKQAAIDLIQKYLKPQGAKRPAAAEKKSILIGHGEILPGTPQPYADFAQDGKKLTVHTPFTPRPYDHAMSNEIHSVMVTNRGLHTSSNGNSQQNRLTPDWPDTVTQEIPVEAFYLYDVDEKEWYSPTYHPLNDASIQYESQFSVDGTAVFRTNKRNLATELTVFVPPKDPTGVYLLKVKNNSAKKRTLRIAPYFEVILSFKPGSWPWERSGNLVLQHDRAADALYFENPRNTFRSGWAFASMSLAADHTETKRGRFFGTGRSTSRPFLVSEGRPDKTQLIDDRQIAGFLGTLELAPGEERTVAVVLGQAENKKDAERLVQKYKSVKTAQKSLAETREWWLNLMSTLVVETNHPEFDRLQHWLKYQALAERIWARRGFYQTSGAYGFRDQLQDTVNMIWVDPSLARKQILLAAAHQFVEGDVFHWFFTLTDGRTAFSARSHASDNPVWLAWATGEYLRETGDETILDEMVSYSVSEFPFAPLPKNKQGWGHIYHRTTRSDTVYRHCLKSIDLVLEDRTGKHGLPLIQTGDWNDGLDEIGSEGRGESVWLGLFIYYILKNLLGVIEKKDGTARREHYAKKLEALKEAIERTWRGDRYLRAIHDDGTEIGVKGSGVWEIDALTAAWAVISGINFEREVKIFDTAVGILEKDNAILLGWPALREDTKPYLGRSSKYPEGVRENGMYCHGVQWLVRAARILAEAFEKRGEAQKAAEYRATAYRLWLKTSAIAHVTPEEIEIYGGQPNKQAADILTNYDRGRMIWHGYTGAAGWMLRQAFQGVVGASIVNNRIVLPADLDKPRGDLKVKAVTRNLAKSPFHSNSKSKVAVVPPEIPTNV